MKVRVSAKELRERFKGTITSRQFHIWGNPCTPETFKRFNKKFKGGASRRGCWFGPTK